jgi:DNA-binding MarR family transcriptional regulator
MFDDSVDFLTSEAKRLEGVELAREVARQRLLRVGTDRSAGLFTDAVLVASAAGLGASEIQRISGCSRQTVYNVMKADPRGRSAGTSSDVQVGVLVVAQAAEGALHLGAIASRLGLTPLTVVDAVRALAVQGCVATDSPFPAETSQISVTPEGEQALRQHFDSLYTSHPDGVAIYVHVDPDEAPGLLAEARKSSGRRGSVLIEASVAPSTMVGPELVFVVHAATQRRALLIAQELWNQARADAKQPAAPMRVADVAPPTNTNLVDSLVLDAYLETVVEAAPDVHHLAERIRRAYTGTPSEKELAQRALTTAARCLRRALGQQSDPPLIRTGDDAFYEWQTVQGLKLEARLKRIQQPLAEGLSLACERMGPFPGGRLGSFARPAGTPNIVEAALPATPEELVRMAGYAGTAVGHAISGGFVDGHEHLSGVIGNS